MPKAIISAPFWADQTGKTIEPSADANIDASLALQSLATELRETRAQLRTAKREVAAILAVRRHKRRRKESERLSANRGRGCRGLGR